MPITILPNGLHVIPELSYMPVKGEACPLCDLMFPDMVAIEVFQEHQARCIVRKAKENRDMINMGYKRTSTGWVKK